MKRRARAARRGPANWHPVLIELIQQKRLVYAIKLWGTICRYRDPDGQIDIARAYADIEAMRCFLKPLPDGTEHPDLDPTELHYYSSQPWRERTPSGG